MDDVGDEDGGLYVVVDDGVHESLLLVLLLPLVDERMLLVGYLTSACLYCYLLTATMSATTSAVMCFVALSTMPVFFHFINVYYFHREFLYRFYLSIVYNMSKLIH